MMTSPDPDTFSLSALQLSWLRELGIEKPWLPVTGSQATAQPATPQVPDVLVAPQAAFATVDPAIKHPAHHTPQKTTQQTTQQTTQVAKHQGTQARVQAREQALVELAPLSITRMQVAPAVAAPFAKLVDLQALADSVHACQACGLFRERERPVVGDGVVRPQVMIVGEAPGDQEDRQGVAFVGRSGELLENMLKAIGQERRTTVYVTNAIKCRPPGNRNPRADETQACQSYLLRQIELVQPRTLLLLGRFAVGSVLGVVQGENDAWQNLRGQKLVHLAAGRSIPVTVSFHPAYLLNRPEHKAAAWQDLLALRALLEMAETV